MSRANLSNEQTVPYASLWVQMTALSEDELLATENDFLAFETRGRLCTLILKILIEASMKMSGCCSVECGSKIFHKTRSSANEFIMLIDLL